MKPSIRSGADLKMEPWYFAIYFLVYLGVSVMTFSLMLLLHVCTYGIHIPKSSVSFHISSHASKGLPAPTIL